MQQAAIRDRGTGALEPEESTALRTQIDEDGEHAVLEACGISRQALYRAAAGLPVHSGTRAAVRAVLTWRRPA